MDYWLIPVSLVYPRNEMSLINICAFNSTFSVIVKGVDPENIKLSILKEGKEIYSRTDKKGSKFNIKLN